MMIFSKVLSADAIMILSKVLAADDHNDFEYSVVSGRP